MAVALGAAGTVSFVSGSQTTITSPSFTVGAGVTALLAVINLGQTTGNLSPTGVTCAWNTTGTMTQIIGPVHINGAGNFWTSLNTFMFWIANPVQVTSTAVVNWTGSFQGCMALISFTGTDTSLPFVNANSNQSTGATPTATITVPPNGGAIALATDVQNMDAGITGSGVTPWFFDTNVTQCATGYGFGSSNLTFNAHELGAPPGIWSVAGVAIQPPATVLSPRKLIMI